MWLNIHPPCDAVMPVPYVYKWENIFINGKEKHMSTWRSYMNIHISQTLGKKCPLTDKWIKEVVACSPDGILLGNKKGWTPYMCNMDEASQTLMNRRS